MADAKATKHVERYEPRKPSSSGMRVLHADPERGDPEDAGTQAVRELVGAGLVHRESRFLAPTRAALYFAALEVT